jgi:tRNA A58 N-methylase Trm61
MGKHKKCHIKSAEEIIKTQEKYRRNEWWDEECTAAISRKNITRKKCLQKRIRANQEQYIIFARVISDPAYFAHPNF